MQCRPGSSCSNCMPLQEMRWPDVNLCLSALILLRGGWGQKCFAVFGCALLLWTDTAAVQEEQDGPQGLVDLSFLPRTGLTAGADSRDLARWHSEPNLDAIL